MRDAARPVPIVRPLRYCSLVCVNFIENKRSALCLCGLDEMESVLAGIREGPVSAARGERRALGEARGDGRRDIDPGTGRALRATGAAAAGETRTACGRTGGDGRAGCPWAKIAAKQIPFALSLRSASSLEQPAALQPCAKEGPFPAELPSG